MQILHCQCEKYGNSIAVWITCIPPHHNNVPRKKSILIDNFEEGEKKKEYF